MSSSKVGLLRLSSICLLRRRFAEERKMTNEINVRVAQVIFDLDNLEKMEGECAYERAVPP